ncbi:TPA: transcription termination factor NusA [candidate division WOR-3 bacterium]|uniref:Transcription termination/antitermination protein NusA n=1 Tax=candidate division WOR-3 bacterium TaxID=2052148 RepID=A0A350HAH8_UNCW3|nr:transcription termination factor NusA [candidate division WOR-3 bacterium]
MDTREIIDAMKEIGAVKNIDKARVKTIIEDAIKKAAAKHFGEGAEYRVDVNEATGVIDIKRVLIVVEEVEEPDFEISLTEAHEFDESVELGDDFIEELNINNFGRKAITTMKQYITSNVLKEERISLFNDFSTKIDNLVNGNIKKIDKKYVYVNLHRIEARMPLDEGIPGERYRLGGLIKAVVLEVRETKSDPEIVLSRKSDKFLQKLLEFEVPEIEEGTVIIKGIARISGKKSKIAVMSVDDKIDPVGACVGVKGSRIHTIIRELNNEHIDIIQWSNDPIIYTQRVISPGVVIRAFKNEDTKVMKLIVKDDTLPKAVGKDGVNVDLASKLTGWKIQVIGENEFRESSKESEKINVIYRLEGLTENQKEKLIEAGFKTAEEIIAKGEDELVKLEGIGKKVAKKVVEAAEEFLKPTEKNENE